jgi:hypothetical protein
VDDALAPLTEPWLLENDRYRPGPSKRDQQRFKRLMSRVARGTR